MTKILFFLQILFSGSSAIRAKNVCLDLVDNHLDLRDGGVIQIFNSPHPTKNTGNSYWDSKKAPNLMAYQLNVSEDLDSDTSLENLTTGSRISLNDEPTLASKMITLPKNYDALSLLQDTEHLDAFIAKSNTNLPRFERQINQKHDTSGI